MLFWISDVCTYVNELFAMEYLLDRVHVLCTCSIKCWRIVAFDKEMMAFSPVGNSVKIRGWCFEKMDDFNHLMRWELWQDQGNTWPKPKRWVIEVSHMPCTIHSASSCSCYPESRQTETLNGILLFLITLQLSRQYLTEGGTYPQLSTQPKKFAHCSN